ncbi:MAG TPA: sigma-70 family RNA polymerase sigma factor [Longimicrobiales bacterium]|nr:sigma-70 family RNA polymerase sigma factor [Longimicrobiales bacterium]
MDFDTTFDEFYLPLVRYCQRMTGDADAAEDAAQEAMVRLFTNGVEGPPPAIRVWLFKTATHLLRDRYRVDENRRRLLQENPVTPSELEGPERRLERTQDRERAREALERLPERDRAMLLMRYEGFSYKEIADSVAVAATSIGTLLARAERRFMDALEGVGETV